MGSEYSIKLNNIHSSKLNIYLLYKEKNAALNSPEATSINYTDNTSHKIYRMNISYIVNTNIVLKNQIEFINYRIGEDYNHHGYLLGQDISYHFIKIPLIISAKYAVTYYSGKKTVGSALDMIQGDTKSEIKLQMIIKI